MVMSIPLGWEAPCGFTSGKLNADGTLYEATGIHPDGHQIGSEDRTDRDERIGFVVVFHKGPEPWRDIRRYSRR